MFYVTSIVKSKCCGTSVKYQVKEGDVVEMKCNACNKKIINTKLPQLVKNKLIKRSQVFE